MELCVQNLDDKIKSQTSTVGLLLYHILILHPSDPAFTRALSQFIEKSSEVLDIISQVLRGIEFIHAQGEVHRDLKPENGNCFPSLSHFASHDTRPFLHSLYNDYHVHQ
jgi:hypothetical protein